MRADAHAERVEVVLLLDAVVTRRSSSACRARRAASLRERVAVERREQQVADADEELDRLDVGLARGRRARRVLFDEQRADEAAAEVGEREALRLEVARRPPPPPTTKSTSVLSGLRRSTVSAVMRAPTMIENAKKRSPTISQSAWKLPMPSPMRSNQPSVRTASSENSLRFSLMANGVVSNFSRVRLYWRGGKNERRAF